MNLSLPKTFSLTEISSDTVFIAVDCSSDNKIIKLDANGNLYENDNIIQDITIPIQGDIKRFSISRDNSKIIIFFSEKILIFNLNDKNLIDLTDQVSDISVILDIQWSSIGQNLIVLEETGSIYFIDLNGDACNYMRIDMPVSFATCTEKNSWNQFSLIVASYAQTLVAINPFYPKSFELAKDEFNSLMKQVPQQDIDIVLQQFTETNDSYSTQNFGFYSEVIPIDVEYEYPITSVLICNKNLYVSLESGDIFIYEYPQFIPSLSTDSIALKLKKQMKSNQEIKLIKFNESVYIQNGNNYEALDPNQSTSIESRMEIIRTRQKELQARQIELDRRKDALKLKDQSELNDMKEKIKNFKNIRDNPPLSREQIETFNKLQEIYKKLQEIASKL